MLAARLGGSAKRAGDNAIWVENTKSRVLALLDIYTRYPPLTTRVYFQVKFLHEMIHTAKTTRGAALMSRYFAARNRKYVGRASQLPRAGEEIIRCSYFSE